MLAPTYIFKFSNFLKEVQLQFLLFVLSSALRQWAYVLSYSYSFEE